MQNKNYINIPHLDGWRGVAIGLLLFGHFLPVPGIDLGLVAVNLFFVLSGLLMARVLFLQAVPIRTFYQRRISRIIPGVFAYLAILAMVRLAIGSEVVWQEMAAAATFLTNYFGGPLGHTVMPLSHIWSLSVEEHSYILLSLIAIAARRKLLGAQASMFVVTMVCALVGLYYWRHFSGQYLEFVLWRHSEVAAYGIVASASLFLYFQRRSALKVPALAVPALVMLGLCMHWWFVPLPARTIVGVGAFALAVNLIDAAPRWALWILSVRPLRQLGVWSFSIYLWQQPFHSMVGKGEMSPLAGLIFAMACGLGSFYLIEQPARRYLNARSKSRRDALIEMRPALRAK